MPAFMVRPCVVLTLSALVIPVALGAPDARPLESAALTNVTVVDVQRGQLLPERTVIIEGGRIQAVRATSEVALPTTGNILDGTGKFLIPGLWDKLEITRMAMEEGVPILAGSDTWNPYAFPASASMTSWSCSSKPGCPPCRPSRPPRSKRRDSWRRRIRSGP